MRNPDGSQGYTWNPISGCLKGCSYCYARKLANGRLKTRYLANENVAPYKHGYSDEATASLDLEICSFDPFYPRFWPEKLEQPCFVKKPSGIFVCNMGELFGAWVPEQWTRSVFNFIEACPQHRFYLLTKQPQNLKKFSPYPPNCYVGVSVTTKEQLRPAIWALSDIQCSIRYLSFEPLLEPVLQQVLPAEWDDAISWVILGSQTKPYKPPKIEWVKEIVEAADKAGVKVFLKDNLTPIAGDPRINFNLFNHHEPMCPVLRKEVPG